jgi:hypothetical protein
MRPACALSAFILFLTALPACRELPPTRNTGSSEPIACFEVSATRVFDDCGRNFRLDLNPTCTTDADTYLDDLSIRWDFQDDGSWDTDFGPFVRTYYVPEEPLSWFFVRCQIVDPEGGSSETSRFLDLADETPEVPDLVAGWIDIWANESSGPSTRVGWELDLHLSYSSRCWVDEPVSTVTALYVDGELHSYQELSCDGTLRCIRSAPFDVSLETGGEHELRIVLDVDDDLVESDESNNTLRRTIYVEPTETR